MSVLDTWKQNFKDQYGYDAILEENMSGAVKNYFMYGISPGSCTSAIIRGDLDRARKAAHPHLLRCERNETVDNITRLYYSIREMLGEHVLDYGDTFPGINHIPEHEQAMIFLESPILNNWMSEAAQTRL